MFSHIKELNLFDLIDEQILSRKSREKFLVNSCKFVLLERLEDFLSKWTWNLKSKDLC